MAAVVVLLIGVAWGFAEDVASLMGKQKRGMVSGNRFTGKGSWSFGRSLGGVNQVILRYFYLLVTMETGKTRAGGLSW